MELSLWPHWDARLHFISSGLLFYVCVCVRQWQDPFGYLWPGLLLSSPSAWSTWLPNVQSPCLGGDLSPSAVFHEEENIATTDSSYLTVWRDNDSNHWCNLRIWFLRTVLKLQSYYENLEKYLERATSHLILYFLRESTQVNEDYSKKS
jgi:hypothetical protein